MVGMVFSGPLPAARSRARFSGLSGGRFSADRFMPCPGGFSGSFPESAGSAGRWFPGTFFSWIFLLRESAGVSRVPVVLPPERGGGALVFPGVSGRTGSVLPHVFSVARTIIGKSGIPFILLPGRREKPMVIPGALGRTGSVLPRVFSVARTIIGRPGIPVVLSPDGRSGKMFFSRLFGKRLPVFPKEGIFPSGLPSSGCPVIRAAAGTGLSSVRHVPGMRAPIFLKRRTTRLLFLIGTVRRPIVKKHLRVRSGTTTGSGVGTGTVPLSGLPRKMILLLISIDRSRKGSVWESGPGPNRTSPEIRGRGCRKIGFSGRPLRRRNRFLPFPSRS